jgi:hypothetical protein
VRLTVIQVLIVAVSLALMAGDVVRASHHPGQAHARRRVEPVSGGDHAAAARNRVHVIVMAIASAVVALPGVLVPSISGCNLITA